MYRYKNLLAALNLTNMDKPVIQYAGMISHMAKTERIYHLHVRRNLSIPKEVIKEYPHLMDPIDETTLQKMHDTVEEHLEGHSQSKKIYHVLEGSPLEEMLNQITRKDIDMLLVGRKTDTTGTRRLPVKLARKAPCSVFVVPEGAELSISKILVPVDFSEHSANAMEVAVAFASSRRISNIQCLHVYQLPLGYYKTGKTEKEFADIIKKHAKEKLRKFIGGIDLKGVAVTPRFILHKNPAKAIFGVIEKEQIDMIIIGARGRNAGAGVLLGSVTEDLILSSTVPLIAVKKKGSGITFLEALFKYD